MYPYVGHGLPLLGQPEDVRTGGEYRGTLTGRLGANLGPAIRSPKMISRDLVIMVWLYSGYCDAAQRH
jgi:hypothetical protein